VGTFCDLIANTEERFMLAEEMFITLSDKSSAHLWSKGPLRVSKSILKNFAASYKRVGGEGETEVEFQEYGLGSILRREDDKSRALEENLDALLSHLGHGMQYWAVD
jgi:hypothetical protein